MSRRRRMSRVRRVRSTVCRNVPWTRPACISCARSCRPRTVFGREWLSRIPVDSSREDAFRDVSSVHVVRTVVDGVLQTNMRKRSTEFVSRLFTFSGNEMVTRVETPQGRVIIRTIGVHQLNNPAAPPNPSAHHMQSAQACTTRYVINTNQRFTFSDHNASFSCRSVSTGASPHQLST